MTAHHLVPTEFSAVEVRLTSGLKTPEGREIAKLYVTFPLGYDGMTPADLVDHVLEHAKASYGQAVTGASYIPVIQAAILDVSDDACIAVGDYHAMPLQAQAVAEDDEPFSTDVVNGDLDDAETAFQS